MSVLPCMNLLNSCELSGTSLVRPTELTWLGLGLGWVRFRLGLRLGLGLG